MSNQRTITGATDTPTNADDGYLLVVDRSGAGDCTITLDTDANQTWTDGDRFGIAAHDGNATVTPAGGVTIDGSAASVSVAQGEEIVLFNVGGGNEWRLNTGADAALSSLTDVTITGAAKGELLVHNGTNWVDVGVGSNDQVLTADSAQAAGVKWAAAAGGGFPTAQNDETGTTYTLVAGDAGDLVSFTNAAKVTVTVPSSVFSAGDRVMLRSSGAGGIIVTEGSGMTFDPAGPSAGDFLAAEGQVVDVFFTSASTADVIAQSPAVAVMGAGVPGPNAYGVGLYVNVTPMLVGSGYTTTTFSSSVANSNATVKINRCFSQLAIDRLSLDLVTASDDTGSTMRMAVYTASATTGTLALYEDLGTATLDGSGTKTFTVTNPIRGEFWVAVALCGNGAATVDAVFTAGSGQTSYSTEPSSASAMPVDNSVTGTYSKGITAGAWDSAAPSTTDFGLSNSTKTLAIYGRTVSGI